MADRKRCDFCSEPDPSWCYPCTDFAATLGSITISGSLAEWLACEGCHFLIEIGHWDSVARRCCATMIAEHPYMDGAEILPQIEQLHRQFIVHRCGDPVPLEVTA